MSPWKEIVKLCSKLLGCLFFFQYFQWCWIMKKTQLCCSFTVHGHICQHNISGKWIYLSFSVTLLMTTKKQTFGCGAQNSPNIHPVGLYRALLTLLWCLTHCLCLSLSISVSSRDHVYLRQGRSSHHIHLGPQWASQHPSRPAGRGLQLPAEGRHLGTGGEHPWARRLSSAAHSKEHWKINTSFTLHSRKGDWSQHIFFFFFLISQSSKHLSSEDN